MKKTLIAGAASVALAAMPVVGVFATAPIEGSPIVDTFNITVSDACSFARKITGEGASADAGHPAGNTAEMSGSKTWAEGTLASDLTIGGETAAAGSDNDTFSASVVAGNTYSSFAKSSFIITCNNAVGEYAVTAYAQDLTDANLTGGVDNTINYNAGAYAGTGSSWFLTSSAAGASAVLPVVWHHAEYVSGDSNTSKLNSDDFTITYNLKVDGAQPVGTYTGSVIYALAEV